MKFMFLILIVVSSPKSNQYIYYALRNKRSRQGQGRQVLHLCMSCLSIFWIKNCRRWSFATLAVLHSINNHHLHPGRMKEKEVGRPKVFSSFCQCTMYDFHNSSYIFEKTKPFASFCTQRASWIYSKNRFPWGLQFKKIRPLAYSFYVQM